MKKIQVLSNREIEVLYLVADGLSNTEIAKELMISIHTVKAHVSNIIQKLCANSRVQAAVRAVRMGII